MTTPTPTLCKHESNPATCIKCYWQGTSATYYAAHPEQVKAKSKAYHAANRDAINAKARAVYAAKKAAKASKPTT